MKSVYSIKDLTDLADAIRQRLIDTGYNVILHKNFVLGKYGFIFEFVGGKKYITGYDSKDICMKKLIDINSHVDEIAVEYCV